MTMMGSKPEYFQKLAKGLKDNKYVTNVELANTAMKDSHCLEVVEALKTTKNLEKLNMESNVITGIGIKAIAAMIEKHPALKELRIENQKNVLGTPAERAVANALSQNWMILKLSFSCRDRSVGVWVDKFMQRNNDVIRRERIKDNSEMEQVPYPFPVVDAPEDDSNEPKVDDSVILTPSTFARSRAASAIDQAYKDIESMKPKHPRKSTLSQQQQPDPNALKEEVPPIPTDAPKQDEPAAGKKEEATQAEKEVASMKESEPVPAPAVPVEEKKAEEPTPAPTLPASEPLAEKVQEKKDEAVAVDAPAPVANDAPKEGAAQ